MTLMKTKVACRRAKHTQQPGLRKLTEMHATRSQFVNRSIEPIAHDLHHLERPSRVKDIEVFFACDNAFRANNYVGIRSFESRQKTFLPPNIPNDAKFRHCSNR